LEQECKRKLYICTIAAKQVFGLREHGDCHVYLSLFRRWDYFLSIGAYASLVLGLDYKEKAAVIS